MTLAVKFVPLSVRIFCGHPCLKIIVCSINYSVTQAVADATRTASTHFVDLSVATIRNLQPLVLSVNGPTTSIEMVWKEKSRSILLYLVLGSRGRSLAHSMQHLTQSWTSTYIFSQKYQLAKYLKVFFVPP